MAQQDDPHPASGDLCLEARIAAADIAPLRAMIERWLQRHEASAACLDGEAREVRYCGGATFYLCPAERGLSVFLHATGEDALRTLAWHSSDLVGALSDAEAAVDLTWVRHPHRRDHHHLRYG